MTEKWYIHSMIITGERPFKQRTKQGLTIAPMKSGRFMLRAKSSLSAKRVKTDPAFKPLMEDATRMKVASPLASKVYRALKIKDVAIYREMVGKAKGWLKAGFSAAEIENNLMKKYGPVEIVEISTGHIIPIRKEGIVIPLSSFYRLSSHYINSA